MTEKQRGCFKLGVRPDETPALIPLLSSVRFVRLASVGKTLRLSPAAFLQG